MSMPSEDRPEKIGDGVEYWEVYDYLDDLRESGDTNMLGAGSYVQDQFGLSRNESRQVLMDWMKDFSS